MPEQLDRSQLQFCESAPTNIRLLAPAGCGKMLSLLLCCKVLADRAESQRPTFLIVTFTVAARQESSQIKYRTSGSVTLRDAAEITTLNSWDFGGSKMSPLFPEINYVEKRLSLCDVEPVATCLEIP